ncbi:hypothetical protein GQ600_11637 [Phytophthora cactorum]|nr:hypothetical protein GQ600_11637 [Phytophthora cactorum]
MPSLSAASLGVILAVDIAQTGVDLLELHQRTQTILTRLRMAANLQSDGDSCSLLSAVRLLCYNPELLGKQGIEVRSCIPHQLPHHDSALLEKLEKYTTTWAASKLVHRSSSRTPTPPRALIVAALPDRVRSANAVHHHPATD